MRSLFITGTDTGVGKTALTAALLTEARRQGLNAAPLKPVQTGCLRVGSRLIAPDIEFCLAAAGWAPSDAEADALCPCKLEPACSPHLAAERSGTVVDIDSLLAAYRALRPRYDLLLVEGAGGALVPLREDYLMLDLMRDMGLPVLVAARAGLGTINHTLLTVRELQRAGLDVFGVVLIARQPSDQDIAYSNASAIERHGGVRVLAHMPFFQSLENPDGNVPILGKNPAHFSKDWKIPSALLS